MISQNAKKHADACRFCWMCRHLCPVGLATGKEINTPRAKGLLLSMVERGEPYTADMAQAMYECMLCDACTNDCATGFEPPLFIREARTQAVVEGLTPRAVLDVMEKIEATGNIYGAARPAFTAAERADTLLLVGEVAACSQPEMARALMSLLRKAGVEFMVLEAEPPTGTMLGDLAGFVAEVRAQAKACADAVNASGAKTVVVLDSYDAVTLKQRWPEWGCPAEAEVVKRIFREYLEGASCMKIARGLERDGIRTARDNPRWHDSTVRKILENEKYMGDALLQKTYTIDFLNKKRGRNNGTLPQYYIEDDHEAIIPKDIFMRVQEEMARRSSERDMNGRRQGFSANHAFSHIVTCECCGEHFRRLHWNNRGKKTIVWRCKTRLEDKTRCSARTVSEDTLQEAFVEAINEMLGNSDEYLKKLKSNLKTAISLANPQSVEALADRMRQLQQELIDLTESGTNYDDLSEEILRLRELQEQTNMDEAAKNERKKRIRELANFIDSQPRAITEFDEALAKKLLEGVRVGETYLEFQFKSGARIVIENE